LAIPKLPPGTLPPVLLPAGQRPLSVAPGDKKSTNAAMQFPADVEAFQHVDLYAGIPGFVVRLNADIGDRVKKGQVLAELAAPELEAEYKQKQARVDLVRAEVEVAHCSAQATRAALAVIKLQVRETAAAIKGAQAKLALRKSEAERKEKLFIDNAVDQLIVDEARNQLEVAKAALDAAEARGLAAKATVEEGLAKQAKAEAEQKVAEAKLVVAQADLQRTAVVLQYAKVQAPFDGIVSYRSVFVGDYARSAESDKSKPLFAVERTDMLRVVIHVPDLMAPRLATGTHAVIRIDAFPGREFKAKIARAAWAIDRTNRTLRAEIDLPNREGRIIPGMSGVVTLVFEK
jgi:multidrug efflux pump subunit AcrA (membrane-fusion protein)